MSSQEHLRAFTRSIPTSSGDGQSWLLRAGAPCFVTDVTNRVMQLRPGADVHHMLDIVNNC